MMDDDALFLFDLVSAIVGDEPFEGKFYLLGSATVYMTWYYLVPSS